MMPRRTGVWLALFAVVAGCLDETRQAGWTNDQGPVILPCVSSIRNCAHLGEINGRDAWSIEGVELNLSVPPTVGRRAAVLIFLEDNELVVMRNMTVRSDAGGVYVLGSCRNCMLLMDNVTLLGSGEGTGIDHEPVSIPSEIKVSLRNVTLKGFSAATGLSAGIPPESSLTQYAVVMRDVQVECGRSGTWIWATKVDVARHNVTGCQGAAALWTIYGAAIVRNSRFSHSMTGLRILSEEGAIAHVRDSVFDGNGQFGVDSQGVGTVEMERLVITNNGHRGREGIARGGVLAIAGGFVRDSVIQGNAEYGVNPGFHLQFDATNNYWGDPNGPRIWIPPGPPVGLGNGDLVSHQVSFYPYRSSPP